MLYSLLLQQITHASVSCSGERVNVLAVGTYCCRLHCRRGRLGGATHFGAHGGRRGAVAYCGGCPPTACYNVIIVTYKSLIIVTLAAKKTVAGQCTYK